jgi:hypothetical protein
MTAENINFDKEVLELEKLLIEQGQIPSPLFRFPGLAHNQVLLNKLRNLGLYALDADTWLAKSDEKEIRNRSVILVHGNGNEHLGVNRLLEELEEKSASIKSKTWQFVSPLLAVPVQE